MELNKLGIIDANQKYKNGEFSAVDMVKACVDQTVKYHDKNAVLEIFEDATTRAKELDEKRAQGKPLGKLAGTVMYIKDNIMYNGKKATCCSKFLKDFVSTYTATALEKLLAEDVIILGRTNMDEFAMGGSTENSCYGPCKNAFDDTRVSGGSSGGSAVAVALDMCNAALGSDTGGSVRQPSSFNGLVGIKPTYGRVSRFGLVAFGSSLDQIGPITKNVKDSAYLLQILAGFDNNDMTTIGDTDLDFSKYIGEDIAGKVIGIEKNLIGMYKQKEYYFVYEKLMEFLKQNGAILKEIEIENIDLSLPVYYIVAPAEASSNLARFDGIKYTTQSAQADDIDQIYKNSRTEGFGKEVKRRIMIGNYVLSCGKDGEYYHKAKKVQQKIKNSFDKVFETVDYVVLPTTIADAFVIGDISSDPMTLYLEDVFTVIANIVGIPAISVPYGKSKNDLPLGVQIFAQKKNEDKIYQLADFIETNYKGGKNE